MIIVVCFIMAFTSCDGLMPKKIESVNDESLELDEVIQKEVSPENYQQEIDDYVRFFIAAFNVFIDDLKVFYEESDDMDDYDGIWDTYAENFEDFYNKVDQLYESDGDYRSILKDFTSTSSGRYYRIANEILRMYDRISIDFSEYKLVSSDSEKKVWKFMERYTEITFSFIWNEEEKDWDIEEDDDSIDRYLGDKVMSLFL